MRDPQVIHSIVISVTHTMYIAMNMLLHSRCADMKPGLLHCYCSLCYRKSIERTGMGEFGV